ncbi:MAG TPA: tripartite tricarboxylate transporter substrate binding protein, partial [Burkholderiales bacterium]
MIRCLLTLCTLLLSFTAAAQPWPARPVKIIAPFAPGGSADTLGRIVAKNLTEQLKETFVVE